MSRHFILVDKIDTDKIERILMQFAELYTGEAFVHGLSLFRKKHSYDSFAITFENEPDLMHFAFLVNYIEYPEKIHLKNPIVRGYYHTAKIKYQYPFVKGTYLMLYVSRLNNTDFDNVDIVNELNRAYRYSFDASYYPLKTIEHAFDSKEFKEADYHHVIDIYPEEKSSRKEVKKWWKFW